MSIIVGYIGTEPRQATKGAAAFDLYAAHDAVILPGEVVKVGTGTFIELPAGTEGLLNVRSSLGAKGVMLANGTGIIDSDYRGEIIAALYNGNLKDSVGLLASRLASKDNDDGDIILEELPGALKISAGERIAQIRVRCIPSVFFEKVDSFKETERGSGGFGSTGSL